MLQLLLLWSMTQSPTLPKNRKKHKHKKYRVQIHNACVFVGTSLMFTLRYMYRILLTCVLRVHNSIPFFKKVLSGIEKILTAFSIINKIFKTFSISDKIFPKIDVLRAYINQTHIYTHTYVHLVSSISWHVGLIWLWSYVWWGRRQAKNCLIHAIYIIYLFIFLITRRIHILC